MYHHQITEFPSDRLVTMIDQVLANQDGKPDPSILIAELTRRELAREIETHSRRHWRYMVIATGLTIAATAMLATAIVLFMLAR
ncbi:MAG: hypothetical protein AAGI68_16735 [Planctomycetota bacterium]